VLDVEGLMVEEEVFLGGRVEIIPLETAAMCVNERKKKHKK
jgi:hypothetical protein